MASLLVTLGLVAAAALPQSRTPPDTTAVRPGAPDLHVRIPVSQRPAMPELIGRTEGEARRILTRLRIPLDTVVYVQMPSARAGTVVRQRPAPGVDLADRPRVELAVAAAERPERAPPAEQPARVVVPEVVGTDVRDALTMLRDARLVGRVRRQVPGLLPTGRVVAQTPDPGTRVDAGSLVVLAVARHTRTLVPDVSGLDSASARIALAEAELRLGAVLREPSDALRGTVIAQRPPPGTEVDLGSTVHVTVALAAPPDRRQPPPQRPDSAPAMAAVPPTSDSTHTAPAPLPDRNWLWLLGAVVVLALSGAWQAVRRPGRNTPPPPPPPEPPRPSQPPLPQITARLAADSPAPEAAVVSEPRSGTSVRFIPRWDPGVQGVVEAGPRDPAAGGSDA